MIIQYAKFIKLKKWLIVYHHTMVYQDLIVKSLFPIFILLSKMR